MSDGKENGERRDKRQGDEEIWKYEIRLDKEDRSTRERSRNKEQESVFIGNE